MKFHVFQTRMLAENASAFTEAFQGAGSVCGEAPLCPTCGDGVGALSWLPPFRVELAAVGTEFGDVAIAGGNNLLVSERFREIYFRNKLRGLSGFEPVEIVRVKRKKKTVGEPPQYLRVAVPYTRTAIDLDASECEWDEPPTCSDCLYGAIRSWRRTIVDESTWTGEDIFIARGSADFIVTQRFKDVCDANHVSNAVFVPAEESGHDFYAAGKL
jgi:hypothetical protein